MASHTRLDERSIAQEVADAIAAARLIPTFSGRDPAFALAEAYRAAAHLREIRGAPLAGRKIGFTNRNIWERYGVDAPMWGDMTDRTVHRLADVGPISLAPYSQPKLEPEIALKLRSVPPADASEAEILAAIEWFAPAFEIVHSIFPGWQFALADCVAMGGLHGALFLGEPVPAGAWAHTLPDLKLTLRKDGVLIEEGVGANALDGPLCALAHLLKGLAATQDPLAPGDIITTGTLTDAQDIAPGETWSATYDASPFAPITARFA